PVDDRKMLVWIVVDDHKLVIGIQIPAINLNARAAMIFVNNPAVLNVRIVANFRALLNPKRFGRRARIEQSLIRYWMSARLNRPLRRGGAGYGRHRNKTPQ